MPLTEYSQSWLEVCAVLWSCSGWRASQCCHSITSTSLFHGCLYGGQFSSVTSLIYGCSSCWCITACISKHSSVSVTWNFVPLLFWSCLYFCGCRISAEVIPNKIRCSQGWFLRHVFGFQAGIFLFSITWGCLLLSQLLCLFSHFSANLS